MRHRMFAAGRRHALSGARVLAWTGAFTAHALAFLYLLSQTAVLPNQWRPATSIAISLQDQTWPQPISAVTPELPTVLPEPALVLPAPRPQSRGVEVAAVPEQPTAAAAPTAAVPSEPPTVLRLDEQRSAIAAQMARESAPQRRPFRGRSIDAMLPGADTGKLPGFRPKTHDGNRETLSRLARILGSNLPSAAFDPDAPSDLLTEGWEAAHHSSDLAGCERQYEQFESDLRRQLCGEVRPPE